MLTRLVAFRVESGLVEALAQKARREGVSVSEYLRTIAREKVGLQ
jgi:predicted DNA binding CopG/RHH family protein